MPPNKNGLESGTRQWYNYAVEGEQTDAARQAAMKDVPLNDPRSMENRTATPPTLRRSSLAVMAFVISLLMPTAFVLQKVYNYVTFIGYRGDILRVYPVFAVSVLLLFPIGLIFAVLGVMRRGHKRRLAVVACVIDGAVLAALVPLIIYGLPCPVF